MQINRDYISNNNTYSCNVARYIVIHNTDNYNAGANAKAHAKAQCNGSFSGMSAHYYVDDGDIVYQAAEHNRGCWHVGKNYGGKLYGIASNKTSVGIEMCVNAGYNYEKAFQNTVALCKQLMKTLGIDADHVIQHYDACAKNCPSAIRAKGDWVRFKRLISESATVTPEKTDETFNRTNSATCTGSGVRVRKGPDTSYGILYRLDKGNRFDVDGQVSNGWYHIHIKNSSVDIVGWIYGDYVELDNTIQTVSVGTGKYGMEVTADILRYRTSPENGDIKGTYSRGTKLFPTGRTVGGHFSEYWFKTEDGWTSGEFLRGWVYDKSAKKWWYNDNGSYPKSKWVKIGGVWYYFKKDGYMAADCYVKASGKDLWYYVDKSGAWQTKKDVTTKPSNVVV